MAQFLSCDLTTTSKCKTDDIPVGRTTSWSEVAEILNAMEHGISPYTKIIQNLGPPVKEYPTISLPEETLLEYMVPEESEKSFGIMIDTKTKNFLYWSNEKNDYPVNMTLITDSDLKKMKMFQSVITALNLASEPITDKGLASLAEFKSLERLHLGQLITDDGLIHLKKLINLQDLSLGSKHIDGSGLAYITGLQKLRVIELWEINDEGLAHLPEFKNLQELTMSDSSHYRANNTLTDSGLIYITKIEKLYKLKFITDSYGDLSFIADLKNLRSLYIGGSNVTDTTLIHISRLKNLKELYIVAAPITDSELIRLQQIKNLRKLDIHYTKVTKTGVEKLQKYLPNCEINFTEPDL